MFLVLLSCCYLCCPYQTLRSLEALGFYMLSGAILGLFLNIWSHLGNNPISYNNCLIKILHCGFLEHLTTEMWENMRNFNNQLGKTKNWKFDCFSDYFKVFRKLLFTYFVCNRVTVFLLRTSKKSFCQKSWKGCVWYSARRKIKNSDCPGAV